ncbi:MAG: DUF4012 domain-containing protein [Candidatus Andersenbacteria bacterium]|nr:DUF4012 domain-containing protein [Candidatus Andersenbacteria bacterium]
MMDIVPLHGAGRRRWQAGRVVRLTAQLPARLRRPARKRPAAERLVRQTRVIAPPYAGKHARGLVVAVQAGAAGRAPRPLLVQTLPPARTLKPQPTERDVPYQFVQHGHIAPRGTSFILPRQRLFGWSGVWSNVGIFIAGCLLVVGAVWQLHGVSLKVAALEPLRGLALGALGNVTAASAALAKTDFVTGEQRLVDAEAALREAQHELSESLGGAQMVLRYLDVTGTIRSGEELLSAGASLTAAGQHLAAGMAVLLDSRSSSLTETITQARNELTRAELQLEEAEDMLARVNSPLLPAEISDVVRNFMARVPRVRAALAVFLEQSDALLTVLGADRERQYLLLFQNNHELRPTGGFIGSVALIDIDRGILERSAVHSVYDLDGQMRQFIAPPDPLLPITDRWYLRDANWFVDWPSSARKAAELFEREGGPTVDGVLALTPEVIRALLAVTGPIDMPEYGVTVDAESFWQVTQDQVTYSYDRERNRPKQFLGDLGPRLLERLLNTRAQSALPVISALVRMIEEKHLLVYFADEEVERRLATAGWAGGLPREQPGILAVNNANIGGHKSDQFMEQEIDVRYEVRSDGDVDAVLKIRRTHRGPAEALDYEYPPGEDPARKDNVVYQRVLVPAGAQLVEAQGFSQAADIPRLVSPVDAELEVDADLAEWQRGQVVQPSGTAVGREAGYTFFANWLVTSPGKTKVATYHYRLPRGVDWPSAWDPAAQAVGYVYKQPGDDRTRLRLALRLPPQAYIVHTAPQEGVTRQAENEILYTGELTRDVMVGAVFEAQ